MTEEFDTKGLDKYVHCSAVYPTGTDADLFAQLIDTMKPFKTSVELEVNGKVQTYDVMQSLPPEFADDFTEWTSDQLDYYVHGLEFLVLALQRRLGIPVSKDFKWSLPQNESAEPPVSVEIGDEKYERPSIDTQEEFDRLSKLRDVDTRIELM